MLSTPFTRRTLLAAAGAAGITSAAGVLATTRPWQALDEASSSVQLCGTDVGGRCRPPTGRAELSSGGGVLVLVTLYGGNDGLNTVVPASDPAYQAGRPTLGYQPEEVLGLADGLGLNPKLPNLARLWASKQLAIVRGVGYPKPNLSHFGSMDIWQTANPVSGSGPGWLGRWLDGTSGDPLRAVSVGATLPTVLRGERRAACALTSTTITLPGSAQSQMALTSLLGPGPDRQGMAAAVAASGRDLLTARSELGRLHPLSGGRVSLRGGPGGTASLGGGPGGTASFGGGPGGTSSFGGRPGGTASLGDQLGIVAALIKAGVPGRVYEVSLASFDTHAEEKTVHEARLAELDAGVGAFFAALDGSSHAGDVVLMTYSEFGRRVAQNASGGTDHGSAAPLFVAGPAVRGGAFYGEQPSLTKLDPNGNLVPTVDFRSVYATMLDRVLGVDPAQVLGRSFPTLGVV